MPLELVYYTFTWLPDGWKHLKADWQGNVLISLVPYPPRSPASQPSENERDTILEEVLAGRLPASRIQVYEQNSSEWSQRVIRAMRAIPFGKTGTYKELAAAAGNPNAARGAARVCAGNRVSLVIPCHRVIASSGELGGFYWGSRMKEAILRWEAEKAGLSY